jgi:hypothetical protein
MLVMDMLFYAYPWLMLTFLVGVAAFSFGQRSKQNPTDREMFDRLVERRMMERVAKEVNQELADEINRTAAGA